MEEKKSRLKRMLEIFCVSNFIYAIGLGKFMKLLNSIWNKYEKWEKWKWEGQNPGLYDKIWTILLNLQIYLT